jgi:hypothetical protein
MIDDEYMKLNPYQVMEEAKKSFLNVPDSKIEEITKPLDGMETFEGAAALSVALMSILSSATPNREHAALAIAAFSSIMIGFLSSEEEEEKFKQ